VSHRPHKGLRVAFAAGVGVDLSDPVDTVTGLRFTIVPQHGLEALVDYTGLRPRRLALAFARALRCLAGPGGPLGVRSTVKAYAITLPRFFAYLKTTGERIDGVEDLRSRHIDGFEAWLEAEGLSRTHLFTVVVKVVAALRQIAADAPDAVSPNLRDRLRYISAKPFQRPRPRDALSPYVARQLRDAARADVIAIMRRLHAGPQIEDDPALQKASTAAHIIIAERGVLTQDDPAWMLLYGARWRRELMSPRLSEHLHAMHHLTSADVVPFLVLISLETGLEIECCKTLTIDCLQNASAGTVEIAYLKRRARGAEHKTIRVRDRGSTTPGGLIRRLIELTAPARRHHSSPSLWVYYRSGALTAGVRQPRETIDAWTARHGTVDDDGRPLRLLLSQLRKTHKALWYLKTEGHMARFAVGHTVDAAARHYADVPSLRPLHEATVAAAFEDALAASAPRVLTPEAEAAWRADPESITDLPIGSDAGALLAGDQDVWLASCGGFYASPYGVAGSPCPIPFWGCLECSNAVITARKLPAILSFLAFIEAQREGLPAGDWAAKFGRAHARITGHILPAFSDAVVADARAVLAADPPSAYLPPEARA
jgi:hypothetical protein